MGFMHIPNGNAFCGIWQMIVIAHLNQTHLFGQVNEIVHIFQERALFLKHTLHIAFPHSIWLTLLTGNAKALSVAKILSLVK